jgi:hypothetical protein
MNFAATTPVWTDHVLTFATNQLYTEATFLTALNAEFGPFGGTWTAANNRFKLTNAESYVLRLTSNEILGIRTPDYIVVPKASFYDSPYTYDMSGHMDTMSIGLPTLYHGGRTSQGSANAKHTRRRDICLTLTNAGMIAFGSYLTYQTQDPTFISLGRKMSVSSLRICLYDQVYNPVVTTNGQPIHLTIEFI